MAANYLCIIAVILQSSYVHAKESCDVETCASDLGTKMESQAVVLYDEKFVSPFHKESRKFSFVGKELIIRQDWKGLGIAAVVWDAAIVLCEYLEKNKDIVHGKKIIELGAGSGIVGIVTALLGGKVTITDLEMALPYVKDVVNENLKSMPDIEVKVQSLDWTTDRMKYSPEYDVVLGADIIYIEDVFDDLLKTFLQICNESTLVLLSWRYRYDRDNKYLEMMSKYFTLDEIFYDKSRDVKIYSGKLIHGNKEDLR